MLLLRAGAKSRSRDPHFLKSGAVEVPPPWAATLVETRGGKTSFQRSLDGVKQNCGAATSCYRFHRKAFVLLQEEYYWKY